MATVDDCLTAHQAFLAAIQAKVQAHWNRADRLDAEYGIDNETVMALLTNILHFVKQSPLTFQPIPYEYATDDDEEEEMTAKDVG